MGVRLAANRSTVGVRGAGLLALLLATGAHAELALLPSLRLTTEERYDDDRLLALGEAGGGQLMTKVSPQAGLTLRDRTLELESLYALDLVVRHGSGTAGLDHRAQVILDQALSRRLQLKGEARLWRVQDPTSLPRLGMARTLSPMVYANAELRGSYQLTRRWTADASYAFEAARVLEDGSPFGFVHEPSLRTWFAPTPRTGIGTSYRFQAFLFDQSIATAHGLAAGYRYRLMRQLTFTAEAGPVFYAPSARGDQRGVLPRVALELTRDGRVLDWTLVAGHDLIGANGFDTALWADYASAIGMWALSEVVNVHAVGSWFRNGRAPNEAFLPFGSAGASTGYALGGGVEWEVHPQLRLQGSLDRVAQVGVPGAAENLARNIASIRMVFTAWAPPARRPGRGR